MRTYDTVLRARDLCSRTDSTANDRARALLQEAIEGLDVTIEQLRTQERKFTRKRNKFARPKRRGPGRPSGSIGTTSARGSGACYRARRAISAARSPTRSNAAARA